MKTFCCALILVVSLTLPHFASANPYLAKSGEAPATMRIATCAISGGFIHLYAALDNGLLDKYGVKVEFVSIRGSGVALAALAADEIQFLYCAADATIPGMAAGSDAKLTNAKTLRERPQLVQKWVAALAEAIQFVERNPDRGKAAVSKALKLNDGDALQ